MGCKIEMPKIVENYVSKDSLPSFVPILVKDTEYNNNDSKVSTVLIHRTKDLVIWFDSSGWIGHSDLEYFNRDRFVVIRKFDSGDKLTITQL